MEKNKNAFLYFIVYILVFLFFSCVALNCFFYFSSFSAARQVPENYPSEYLRIQIYGSSVSSEGNTISGTFSIIDSNGNEIAKIERSWAGAYLALDFTMVKIRGNKYFFPSRIYGKNKIIEEKKERKKGTLLEKYYNDYGQCMLLGYGTTLKDRKNLYKISVIASEKYHLVNLGLTKKITIDLSECKNNVYYTIGTDKNGNFEIKEL